MRPQPEVVIPGALRMGEILVATGNRRGFTNLGSILGQKAASIAVERTDSRAVVVERMDAIWKRHPVPLWERPALLLHFPPDFPGFDPDWLAAGAAVVDFENRQYARVIKLRNFDDEDKALWLYGRRARVVEAF